MEEAPEIVEGVVEDEGESSIQTTIYEGFDKLTPTERRIMSLRGVEARKAKREAKKLAELETWAAAHRDVAGELFEIKVATIRGLVDSATVVPEDKDGNPIEGAEPVFQPKLLGDKNLKTLLAYIADCEKAGFKSEVKKETTTTVNVLAVMADLKKALG